MTEELLTVAQAAYLMSAPRRTIEYMVQKGKLETGKSKKKILIKQTSFISLIEEKTERYIEAKKYIAHMKLNNEGTLTIPTAAKLLQISNQGIYYLIQTGKLKKDQQSKKAAITLQSFERHIQRNDEKYHRAIEYLQCDDTYHFWLESDIENLYESERERRYKNG